MRAYESPTVTLLGRVDSRAADPVVVDVRSAEGWRLMVIRRLNDAFDATLYRPDGSMPYSSAFRRGLRNTIDKACSYLAETLREPKIADRLRLLAAIETCVERPGGTR